MLILDCLYRYIKFRQSPIKKEAEVIEEVGYLSESSACTRCGETSGKGIWRRYSNGIKLFGGYISTENSGTNIYCVNCSIKEGIYLSNINSFVRLEEEFSSTDGNKDDCLEEETKEINDIG